MMGLVDHLRDLTAHLAFCPGVTDTMLLRILSTILRQIFRVLLILVDSR
jgi:hypothetical protein